MLTTWILSDGKAGTEGQAIGLANALRLNYVLFRLRAKGIWKWLPAWLWFHPLRHVTPNLEDALKTTKPDIIIAGGRITAMPTKYLREKYGTFSIFILNPYISPKHFDVVICPQHDHLKGENVIEVIGALHRLTSATLKEGRRTFQSMFQKLPAPRIAVLVGGNTKHVTFTEVYVKSLIQYLKRLAIDTGGSILMTVSRRTPLVCVAILKQGLKDMGVPAYFWEEEGPNPYMGMLAWGDAIVVTGDSASMVVEACFTGKPVYIYDAPNTPAKFQELHQVLYQAGHAKPLEQVDSKTLTTWTPKRLEELPRIIQIVQQKLHRK